ncbi:MAG: glycerate kinase [Planctomycetes bacterium]|nr:glycerate kinase [Planctomycetota bacterium]
MRRALVMPGPMKGTLSARLVAKAMASGVRAALGVDEIDILPVGDGGRGTLDAWAALLGAEFRRVQVSGPLGEPVRARFAIVPAQRLAIVEAAEAIGLDLVSPASRDPRRATSRGVGELVRASISEGCRQVILGMGDTATVDGGAGMIQALGVLVLDRDGEDLRPGGADLARLRWVDNSSLEPAARDLRFELLADVTNPLLGPEGAAAVFGPQKGASAGDVAELEAGLARLAGVLEQKSGRRVRDIPGLGAAGGLGAPLVALWEAQVYPGAARLLQRDDVSARIAAADVVITGEGRYDAQSAAGKAPHAVMERARALGRPVVGVFGQAALPPGVEGVPGFDRAVVLSSTEPATVSEDEQMERVRVATAQALRSLFPE